MELLSIASLKCKEAQQANMELLINTKVFINVATEERFKQLENKIKLFKSILCRVPRNTQCAN